MIRRSGNMGIFASQERAPSEPNESSAPSAPSASNAASDHSREEPPHEPEVQPRNVATRAGRRRNRPTWVLLSGNRKLPYEIESIIGKGAFGTVYRARNLETKQLVAIKRTKVPFGFHTHEPAILRQLHHRNVVEYKHAFSAPSSATERELFLVTEFMSCDLERIVQHVKSQNHRLEECYIMVYMYQILKGLQYIHELGIAHRDLKPANILLNLSEHAAKLADFGSAKKIRPGWKSTTYICSRFYRAPELLLDCENYTTAVDMWSCGCLFAELYNGEPPFIAKETESQLDKIEAVLGTPTMRDLCDFGKGTLPERRIPPQPLRSLFRPSMNEDAVDLIQRMLVYSPKRRIDASTALRHSYFNPIREPGYMLPLSIIPTLFDSDEERQFRSRADNGLALSNEGSSSASHDKEA